jgi:hypothetical protein
MDLPKRHAFTAARLISWIQVVDDLFDERALALEEARGRALSWSAIAGGGVTRASDDAGHILGELRAELLALRPAPERYECWSASVAAMLGAMQQEYEHDLALQQTGALPSLRAYLKIGSISLGMPLMVATLALLVEPGMRQQGYQLLRGQLWRASLALRYYNDIGSLSRELEEKRINAITILAGAPTEGAIEQGRLEQARARVRRQAQACARAAEKASARQDETALSTMISRIVAFNASYYGDLGHDYNNPP